MGMLTEVPPTTKESSPVQSRNTRQKEAIRSAFLTEDRPLSPEETLSYAQEQVEGISIATIYRNISTLVEENWLTPVSIPGESTRYELAGKEHHHHFRCNSCGKVYEMPGSVMTTKPKLPRGFRATRQEFFLFGTCPDCK
jgi:Fur family transcriptional regulator, ferric uptake regulator